VHPLIASALLTQLIREPRVSSRRRTDARGTPRPTRRQSASADGGDVVIRAASPADAPALVRLGALDGNRAAGELLADAAAHHAVLVAEVDGSIEAALAIDGGLSVADPFRPSALDLQLLSMRARQLGGHVPRHRGHRLGVLHPRTS
jgi:hypothetical protein